MEGKHNYDSRLIQNADLWKAGKRCRAWTWLLGLVIAERLMVIE